MALESQTVGFRPQSADNKLLLRFRVLQRIGRSGMAEVFTALDEIEGVYVAFKRFLPEIVRDEEVMSIVLDEAEQGKNLSHQAICAVRAWGRAGKTQFIASELAAGRDLQQLIEQHSTKDARLPIAVALHIGIEVCSALDYAHQLGRLHQNLVPRNIRITDDGLVKVTDFGIGRAANYLLEGRTRILKRRYGYMSPEMVRGNDVDHRSDIFALGSDLYELLTGVPAFVGPNELALLDRVRRGQTEPLHRHREDIPEALQSVVMRALEPRRHARWETAEQMLGALEELRRAHCPDFGERELAAWLESADHGAS